MALTKVNRGGLNTGVFDSSNATFLTVDSSEQAVIKSEGGAVTTSVQQGLAKSWMQLNGVTFGLQDSLNVVSATDSGTGAYLIGFSSNFNNDDYAITATSRNTSVGGVFIEAPQSVLSTSQYNVDCIKRSDGALTDAHYVMTQSTGDLA